MFLLQMVFFLCVCNVTHSKTVEPLLWGPQSAWISCWAGGQDSMWVRGRGLAEH